jgi:hypothetical protein
MFQAGYWESWTAVLSALNLLELFAVFCGGFERDERVIRENTVDDSQRLLAVVR